MYALLLHLCMAVLLLVLPISLAPVFYFLFGLIGEGRCFIYIDLKLFL